jgi:hypothetical protein
MAEGSYELLEPTGTPILNGYGSSASRPEIHEESEDRLTVSVRVEAPLTSASRTLDWKQLYPGEVGGSGLILRARALLTRGEQSLRKARDCMLEDDIVGADYEVTLFQGAIPELFCCKSLGDGFAAIVVALSWALKNRHGDPLTIEQLNTVLNCVVCLNKQLFLTYETALNLIDDLDEANLNTDPSIATPLATLLIGEAIEPTDEGHR